MTSLEALKKYFGHTSFRTGQEEIIQEILCGTSVLAIFPTGAGKSVCYQIPALISDNYSIVISPLIALMKDQVDSLNRNTEIAAFINSTMSYTETERVLQDITFGKLKLVYVAPERLENTEFALRLKNLKPEFLFIDEAHCISQWGHNFRPSYTKLKDFIQFTSIKKISAFTATATPEVVKDIIKQLGLKNTKLIVKGFERDNLFLRVEITKRKKERCQELLNQHSSPAIIYTSSRKKAEELAEFLQMNRIKCEYYHAGLDPAIRRRIQDDFIEDRIPVIIATNAFGMGIDKKDIRLVIHFNSPGSIENYYQEIGRAGRDGNNSFTYLLFDDNDLNIHNFFISNSYPTKELIKNIYNALCDSAQIAVGMKSEKDIQLNIDYIKLHSNQHITQALLHSSLRYLEEAGYIKINSAYKSSDKIKILFDNNRLKSFIKKTENELLKDLLLHLLRNYGQEIFTKTISFNIDQTEKETGLTKSELEESLNMLEYLGIIDLTKSTGKETISLIQARTSSEDLSLNYKLINELYISSKQKLDKMVDYVYTRECRFRFILKYFGDAADTYSCCKCDNCSKDFGLSDHSISYIKEKIIELLNEVSIGLTEKQIINILLGKNKINSPDMFQSTSVLSGYNKTDILSGIKQLILEGNIQSETKVRKIIYTAPNKNINIFQDDSKIPITETNYEANLELFHVLREIREITSKKFLQSNALVCPDEVMTRIAKQKPKTKSELLIIPGFNQRMFNKIGNEFLEVLNSFVEKKHSTKISDKKLPSNVAETYNLLKMRHTLEEISKLRKLNEAVISMQIETILEYFPKTDISVIVDKAKLDIIRKETEKGFKDLREIKDRLPKNISYSMLRIALAKIKTAS